MTRAAVALVLAVTLWTGVYRLVTERAAQWESNLLICQLQCHKAGREYAVVSVATGACDCAGVYEDQFETYCADRAAEVFVAR